MSYFPEDIPFMSKEELRENGIRIPKDATDTNVGNNSEIPNSSDAINRQDAIDALDKRFDNIPMEQTTEILKLRKDLRELPTIQPEKAQLSQGGTIKDAISKFIDGLEEIFADLRERHVDDSVCGLCEYDGAYMGQSGDWCNECPGFDRDDCFKLSDETRKKWTDEIIKALPAIQPEPRWIPVNERLPEPRIDVWVNSDLGQMVGYYDETVELWYGRDYLELIVNAWMPLPKPYTERRTDEI